MKINRLGKGQCSSEVPRLEAKLGLEVRPPDPWFKHSQSEALAYNLQGSALSRVVPRLLGRGWRGSG